MAFLIPAYTGLKRALMVQDPPETRLAPQLFDSKNERGFGPVIAMPVILREPLPVLVKMIGFTAELVCTFSAPKTRLLADNFTPGEVVVCAPLPVRVMAWD